MESSSRCSSFILRCHSQHRPAVQLSKRGQKKSCPRTARMQTAQAFQDDLHMVHQSLPSVPGKFVVVRTDDMGWRTIEGEGDSKEEDDESCVAQQVFSHKLLPILP